MVDYKKLMKKQIMKCIRPNMEYWLQILSQLTT